MYKKSIILILLGLIFTAGIFQITRLDIINKATKNVNVAKEIGDPIKINIPSHVNKEKFLIIYDEMESGSLKIRGHLNKILKKYMKKNIVEVSVNEHIEDFHYDTIIIALEYIDNIKNLENIMNFAQGGGTLIFMERPLDGENFNKIHESLGIVDHKGLLDIRGIKLKENILIGVKEFQSNEEFIENSSMDVILNDKSRVYATSYDDIPLLWSNNYGHGKIIVFNGTITNEKLNTGLMAGIISLSREDFIYPIINCKLVHIDDFPAPVPEGINDKIYKEYARTIPQFYREIWWGDMLKFSKKYNIKYTSYIIETYNDRVREPFSQDDPKAKNYLLIYGREVLKHGGEIGIHGYNHQSLAPEGYIKEDLGYNPWDSEETMVGAVKEVINYGHSVFPHYTFRTYVPPSNILSPEGRRAIKKGMPHLKIISGLYLKNYTGDVYEQEFEISEDGIIEFPRLTYGYTKRADELWTIYNGVSLFGVFSHFIHPDDILDTHRSDGKSWSELSKEFEEIQEEIYKKYGWLRANTTSEAGINLIKYEEADPYIKYGENEIEIYCNNFRPNMYFILRTNKAIKKFENCKVQNIDEGIYLIQLEDSKGTIYTEKKE
ncbi:DUF2194 domain-containing protein [Anaeromicrobium sediminis]|uniref:DUF2194 domain-containing protein n=1 Tax=Anaeromicrobium sediminis TaxID=1478221 RepID=A0A267MG25_9FIRM|nr:DUF2194 domain-containing protein [Anaeromicrobium sediminis]PAB57750.1 hypothetical protein CCE28_18175 [Anaeromicrobium sediminis]